MVPNTRDLMAIQIQGAYGMILVCNIYTDCWHSRMLCVLDGCIREHRQEVSEGSTELTLWCRDLNQHHLMWDEERNKHLFMAKALKEAGELLELVTDHNIDMVLPKDILTLEAKLTKNWTQPDNVFCSTSLVDLVVSCNTDPKWRGLGPITC